MPSPRYLTKSRFKLAVECSTKLYYTGKKEYPDQKINDKFLEALAHGGFQVGELAKCYFPGGVMIDDLDYEIALAKRHHCWKGMRWLFSRRLSGLKTYLSVLTSSLEKAAGFFCMKLKPNQLIARRIP